MIGAEEKRKEGRNRTAGFSPAEEREDIDGYGDLMAYCSTSDRYRRADRFVMSSVTLSDAGTRGRATPAY